MEEIEIFILSLLKDFLMSEDIDLEQTFFEIGGDSLLAKEIEEQVLKKYNVHLSIQDFYSITTLKDLCRLIFDKTV
jgi:polyketide synthase PksJ